MKQDKSIQEERLRILDFEIEQSKYMLEYKENYDDEGSIPPNYLTWRKTINLIEHMVWFGIQNYNCVIDIPKFYHANDEGLDIAWDYNEHHNYSLLLNFTKDGEINWYGRNSDGQICSTRNNSDLGNLIYWLYCQLQGSE